jgi:endonuclease V-like protein UPF0215 family
MRFVKIPLSVILLAGILLAGMAFAKADHLQELVVGQDVPVIFVCNRPQPMIDAANALKTSKEDADVILQAGAAAGMCVWLSGTDTGELVSVLDSGVDVDNNTFSVVIVRSPYNNKGFYTILWVGEHDTGPAPNQEDS